MTQEDSSQSNELEQQLRQCIHDVRTPLGIISTGLEALKLVREDAGQFAQIHASVQQDGVDKLTQRVEELIELARRAIGSDTD